MADLSGSRSSPQDQDYLQKISKVCIRVIKYKPIERGEGGRIHFEFSHHNPWVRVCVFSGTECCG